MQLETLHESVEFLTERLEQLKKGISLSELPLLDLYRKKIDEISVKISLLDGYKRQDPEIIGKMNDALYGALDEDLLLVAQEKLLEANRNKSDKTRHLGRLLTLDEVVLAIEEYFRKNAIR